MSSLLADIAPPADSLPGGEAAAPPLGVVLVHGMRQDASAWEAQVAHLEAGGHHAVPLDLPGHGTRLAEQFTLERAWAHIDDAVADLPEGTPVVLVGQSLGGYVSLGWAARHATAGRDGGARLAGVVASGCSTDPLGKPVALYRGVAAGIARAGGAVRRRADGAESGKGPARPGWDLVTDALGQLAGRSVLSDVAAVRSPVWLLNGARCHLRWQEQRFLRSAASGALVVVPRVGHDVHLEAPDVYNRVLTRALSDFAHR
ncbi:alpha/beta fold hydrolase [Isoptericola aurantiacus]|uniref:alpha/beta fold hydrolase n=1 Tax=Isoptericola aurantiacus TaxID=3377839 RepID=UPI00383AC1D4